MQSETEYCRQVIRGLESKLRRLRDRRNKLQNDVLTIESLPSWGTVDSGDYMRHYYFVVGCKDRIYETLRQRDEIILLIQTYERMLCSANSSSATFKT